MGCQGALRTSCRPRMHSGLGVGVWGGGPGRACGLSRPAGEDPRRSLLPDVCVAGAGWLWVSTLLPLRAEVTARGGSSSLRCSPPISVWRESQ